MRFIVKTVFLTFLFLFALLIFLHKESLYNQLEKSLEKSSIVVSNETRKEKLFGLQIKGAQVYYRDVYASLISSFDFTTYLFVTDIKAKNIRVAKSFENILPSKIDSLILQHSVLSFDKILVSAKGDFGEFDGEVLLLDKKITGVLKPSSLMKSKYRTILRDFKLVDGKYKYEFKY